MFETDRADDGSGNGSRFQGQARSLSSVPIRGGAIGHFERLQTERAACIAGGCLSSLPLLLSRAPVEIRRPRSEEDGEGTSDQYSIVIFRFQRNVYVILHSHEIATAGVKLMSAFPEVTLRLLVNPDPFGSLRTVLQVWPIPQRRGVILTVPDSSF